MTGLLGAFRDAGTPRAAYVDLLIHAEGQLRAGTLETPDRAARTWAFLTNGYNIDIATLFTTFESENYQGVVSVDTIRFYSLCEHHLLPFLGTVDVAYRPNGRIVGLSKIARLVDAYARRLQVQERMTSQIADAMVEHLHPLGVSCTIRAEHLCMAMRGVEAPGTITTTTVTRGDL